MSENDEYLEEDGRTLYNDTCTNTNENNIYNEASPKKTYGLDLNLAKVEFDGDEEQPIQEQDILVVFDLPDGSCGEFYFKMGQTVEVLKQYVELEYGIPMHEQKLFYNDVMMIDPLSLLDYPEVKSSEEVFVRVEGVLPAEAKK